MGLGLACFFELGLGRAARRRRGAAGGRGGGVGEFGGLGRAQRPRGARGIGRGRGGGCGGRRRRDGREHRPRRRARPGRGRDASADGGCRRGGSSVSRMHNSRGLVSIRRARAVSPTQTSAGMRPISKRELGNATATNSGWRSETRRSRIGHRSRRVTTRAGAAPRSIVQPASAPSTSPSAPARQRPLASAGAQPSSRLPPTGAISTGKTSGLGGEAADGRDERCDEHLSGAERAADQPDGKSPVSPVLATTARICAASSSAARA